MRDDRQQAGLVRYQKFSAYLTLDLKTRLKEVNQGLNLDLLLSVGMGGVCLSSKEERVILYAIKRFLSSAQRGLYYFQ